MAKARLVQRGEAVDYTPGSAVTAGDVIVQGALVGVPANDIAANALGALAITGVFDVQKAQEAFASVGARVYWDADGNPYGGTAGTGAATATPTSNAFMGFVVKTALANDATVRVLLRSSGSIGAEAVGLGDLSDVDPVVYTAGHILVADGTKYDDLAVSGDGTLSGAGVLAITSFAAMPTIPVAEVAATGSDQAGAAAIATGFTHATEADAAKGVKLPAAAAGKVCVIKNADAANAVLKVYPGTSDAINALSANAALSMAAKTSAWFIALDATTWYTVPLLPS